MKRSITALGMVLTLSLTAWLAASAPATGSSRAGEGSEGQSPTPTGTPCGITFSDVLPADYFYEPVRYLFCVGAVSGYADGTFRPYNFTTRAQMTKVVVVAFNIPEDTGAGPTFNDVPPDHPFYRFVETAAVNNIVTGYECGGPGEPCPGRYFRPYSLVTRGQLTKLAVVAAGWSLINPPQGTFNDVLPDTAFYEFIETAYCHGIIAGYSCGAPGEPCPGLYFRQFNNATRGQIAKIAYNALHDTSGCGAIPTLTPSETLTPAVTDTATNIPTSTATGKVSTATNTATNAATNTATITSTPTPTPPNTATNTPSRTGTFTSTFTSTFTRTGTRTNTHTVTSTSTATATSTPTPGCLTSKVDVAIVDFAFAPQNITITVGTVVTWTNTGVAPHTTTEVSTPVPVWDSGTMATGATFSFTFNTPGSFSYYCVIHPSMTGTVTVLPACPPTPTATGTPVCVTTTYASTDVPRPIGPGAGVVTTSTLTIPDGITIGTIEVVGLTMAHTFPGDLDVFLIHPSGAITVELFTDVCGTIDWATATTGFNLADNKGGTIGINCPPGQLNYRPEGLLNAFMGQSAQGTWTLHITDDTAPNGGTLGGWGLRIGSSGCPTPTRAPTFLPTVTATPT